MNKAEAVVNAPVDSRSCVVQPSACTRSTDRCRLRTGVTSEYDALSLCDRYLQQNGRGNPKVARREQLFEWDLRHEVPTRDRS